MPEMRGVGEQGHVKTRKESMNAVPKRNLEMDVAKLDKRHFLRPSPLGKQGIGHTYSMEMARGQT